MIKNLIEIKNLCKKFYLKNNNIVVLDKINFVLKESSIVSITGPSGSGKSTFLNIIGLLDSNFDGKYHFNNKDMLNYNKSKKNVLRNNSIGFVHQFFHLIPELSVLENVALPYLIFSNDKKTSYLKAENIINKFGLSKRILFKPFDLSGGEQQRVAIARSLINSPKLIIADEMTGNLDEETSDIIFNFFIKEIKKNKQSLIYVTHNNKYANLADIKYRIYKKNIVDQ